MQYQRCVVAMDVVAGKSQLIIYEHMLRAIVAKADERGCSVDPSTAICDFEAVVINAVGVVLEPHVYGFKAASIIYARVRGEKCRSLVSLTTTGLTTT